MTPPRDPTQVPPPLKDDVGKHDESDFNEGSEEESLDEDEDDLDTSDFED